LTFYKVIKLDETVKKSKIQHVRRGRYRKLIDGLFDPDTDPDPDADNGGMVLLRRRQNLVETKYFQPSERRWQMKMRYVLAAVILLINLGCSDSSCDNPKYSSMQRILDSGWEDYSRGKPGFCGGLAMQILSPGCDCFLSTAMGDVRDYSSFRCASTTKTFTAAAIMLLHQEGLLDIHDYITENITGTSVPYVPDSPEYDIPYKDRITIKMLLMHRAGVFDLANSDIPEDKGPPYGGENYIDYIKDNDFYHPFTFDELLGVVAAYQLSEFEPEVRYGYSNTGYSLLGKIIEQVSGVSYNDFIMEELIVPNGLIDTFPVSDPRQTTLPAPFVPGYMYTGDALIDVTEDNLTANIAEGNIITTPYDLALWCQKLMTGEAGLTTETVNMMMEAAEPQAEGSQRLYGLGLEYHPSLGWGHNGAQQGYLTDMYYDPEKEASRVIFANVWNVTDGLTSLSAQALAMRSINEEITALLE
jgi:D-alanyl-D-alanine carboxypeptidase